MTTTEQPTQTQALTREDVAALRLASSVTFSHWKGQAVVRAILDVSHRTVNQRIRDLFPILGDAVGPEERTRHITVQDVISGYHLEGMGGWHVEPDDQKAACFHMIHSARYCDTWPTVADLLREGDTLILDWKADNNTATVREAGLHLDALRLTTVSASGKRRTFHIATTVTPDNTARMIKRFG